MDSKVGMGQVKGWRQCMSERKDCEAGEGEALGLQMQVQQRWDMEVVLEREGPGGPGPHGPSPPSILHPEATGLEMRAVALG